MRYLAAIILTFCFFGSASAQILILPEREIVSLAESILSGDDSPEFKKMKCGDYFLYAGADSKVPFIGLNMKRLPSDKENVRLLIIMQKRNVEVRVDNKKEIPTAEVLPGPKLILRINRADYEKATRCLPRPLGA